MNTHPHQKLKQYVHDGTRWHHIFSQTRKKKSQCQVIRCQRPARVRVHSNLRIETCRTCITCESRLWRANHPDRDAYRQIKDRALRRGQIFEITFEQFLQSIAGTDYLARRGTGRNELHLDRIRVKEGYVMGNLQVITTAENLRKQREVDYAEGPF